MSGFAVGETLRRWILWSSWVFWDSLEIGSNEKTNLSISKASNIRDGYYLNFLADIKCCKYTPL